jgi:hypothetical protein
MEDDVQMLLYSLERVIDATNEHDKVKEQYNGYSWGYAGSSLIYERDKARIDFSERLCSLIDSRVEAALRTADKPRDVEDGE